MSDLEQLRNMKHLIEMENLPEIENLTWNKGWVRFYDTTTTALICISTQTNKMVIHIGDYKNHLPITIEMQEKLLMAEQYKSNNLENNQQNITNKIKKFI